MCYPQKTTLNKTNRPFKVLTYAECSKLLLTIANSGKTPTGKQIAFRNVALTLLMLDAGLRVGEVVKLLWGDLFFNEQPVRNLEIRPAVAKLHIPRIIPVSYRLSEALRVYSIWCSPPAPLDPHSPAFIFFGSRKALTIRQIQRIIRNASISALGEAIHPHTLRHTFATLILPKTNIRVVQQLLGHSSLTSTQVYTHPNSTDLREAIDSLGK